MKLNAPTRRGTPGGSNILLVAVVNVIISEVAAGLLVPGHVDPPPVLDPHQRHVEEALQRVAADPPPDRRVRLLFDGAGEHHHRDHHEGRVPRHVERHHRLRVCPVGAALLELTGRRLPDDGGAATAAEKECEDRDTSCGGIGTREKERRVGLRGGVWR